MTDARVVSGQIMRTTDRGRRVGWHVHVTYIAMSPVCHHNHHHHNNQQVYTSTTRSQHRYRLGLGLTNVTEGQRAAPTSMPLLQVISASAFNLCTQTPEDSSTCTYYHRDFVPKYQTTCMWLLLNEQVLVNYAFPKMYNTYYVQNVMM